MEKQFVLIYFSYYRRFKQTRYRQSTKPNPATYFRSITRLRKEESIRKMHKSVVRKRPVGSVKPELELESREAPKKKKTGASTALAAMKEEVGETAVYVVGGHWGVGLQHAEQPGIEQFLPSKNAFNKVATLLTPRTNHATCVLHNCIYILGGFSCLDNTQLTSVEKYNLEDKTVSYVACMQTPKSNFSVCAVNGYLYALEWWKRHRRGAVLPST